VQLIDLSLERPAANLALDEALLEACDEEVRKSGDSKGCLRFWESLTRFVVLGVSGRIEREVDESACEREGIPVLRRGSGGGTVVQGPGCLDFALIVPTHRDPRLRDVHASYSWFLDRTIAALGIPGATLQGSSDLAVADRKFGGSAQKRTARAILHHSTILYDFDLSILPRILRLPEKQPDYRGGRAHLDFVTNIGLSSAEIRSRIAAAWGAVPADPEWQPPPLEERISERFENPAWIRRS
jgi:lipoate-protein ligase A